jgi:hypothetical protein
MHSLAYSPIFRKQNKTYEITEALNLLVTE